MAGARILLAMMHEFPIASVTVAKKNEFRQLHTADFLAYSRSTTDIPWMDRLFAKKRVAERAIEGHEFAACSEEISKSLKKYRGQKAAARRQRNLQRKT